MSEKVLGYDVDGEQLITTALINLINEYPGLEIGEKFSFASLGDQGGLSIYPLAGAAIQERKVDVIGHVREKSNYPFAIVNRAYGLNQSRKIKAKEWMDALGRWFERQPIKLGDDEYQLKKYPELSEGRTITSILRTSPAYIDTIEENKSENWVISMSLTYEREYQL